MQETQFQYLVERVPWRRGRQPIPVFLLGDFHGHRNLVGYSPCGHKHLNTTEQLTRRRQWHPTPVFLPGKSHGRRCLVGCSPWGHTESDTTDATTQQQQQKQYIQNLKTQDWSLTTTTYQYYYSITVYIRHIINLVPQFSHL